MSINKKSKDFICQGYWLKITDIIYLETLKLTLIFTLHKIIHIKT